MAEILEKNGLFFKISDSIEKIIKPAFRLSTKISMTIRFSLKSRPSEQFHRPEMSQIKAEISLRTNMKLIFHKNVGWQGYQWIS